MKSPNAFRTISEVSKETKIPAHVLRFWETKFSKIKPLKRSGNRRYYRPEDVQMISKIKTLLYENGYTVKGVQKLLDSNLKKDINVNSENNKNIILKNKLTNIINNIDDLIEKL